MRSNIVSSHLADLGSIPGCFYLYVYFDIESIFQNSVARNWASTNWKYQSQFPWLKFFLLLCTNWKILASLLMEVETKLANFLLHTPKAKFQLPDLRPHVPCQSWARQNIIKTSVTSHQHSPDCNQPNPMDI